jgi:response regulator RpfG family c-di-GMP phosphodiesterase
MTEIAEPATGSTPAMARILCVDDEPNILSSLQRLFRGAGYQVRVSESGTSALLALEAEPADIVISDMRMPGMDGAQFLHQVRVRWPLTVQFLLSGQADVASVIDVVNQGAISRYITKPWDDDELLRVVGEAIKHKSQELDKAHLAAIALSRSEELKALNASLEQNVNASKDELAAVNERLKNNFVVSLKVFASLIEVRSPHLQGHSRRVADLARKIATKLELEAVLVQEVFVAGLLHELGKLGFSDELLVTPVAVMKPWQLLEYRKHPGRAEQLLMPLQDLRGAAASIGAQLERFDGAGYPKKLNGRAILIGARILAVCADYHNMQAGVLAPKKLSAAQSLAVVKGSSGKRYDPWVVDAFELVVNGGLVGDSSATTNNQNDRVVSAVDLKEGMVLSRDLVSASGLMMLPANHVIDARLIEKMCNIEQSAKITLTIYIKGP